MTRFYEVSDTTSRHFEGERYFDETDEAFLERKFAEAARRSGRHFTVLDLIIAAIAGAWFYSAIASPYLFN